MAAPLGLVALVVGFVFLLWVRTLPAPWVDFKDPKGIFEVQFPDPPRAQGRPMPTFTGSVVSETVYTYGSGFEDEQFTLGVFTLDAELPYDKFEATFAAAFDEMLKPLETAMPRITARRAWTLGGHPGRETVVDIEKGEGTFVARVIVIDRKHVVRLSTLVHAHHHGENDERFLQSFKLLGR
jgi:hypothetical protein